MTTATPFALGSDTHGFLAGIYAHCDPDGWLTLFARDRRIGANHTRWARVADLENLVDEAHRLAHCCVWFGVATRRQQLVGSRGGARDCAQIPALWVDIDIADPRFHARPDLPPSLDAAHQLLDDHPLRPTVTVNTGGGLQAWWLLDEPLDAQDSQPTMDAWGATWIELGRRRNWHVDNVFDVARIMRLPGTTNTKETA